MDFEENNFDKIIMDKIIPLVQQEIKKLGITNYEKNKF